MIKRGRKKPLVIEFMQFTGTEENLINLSEWSKGQVTSKDSHTIFVQCLEALAESPLGSYIVMGVKGEVWPVREDIFNETYEVLNDEIHE